MILILIAYILGIGIGIFIGYDIAIDKYINFLRRLNNSE